MNKRLAELGEGGLRKFALEDAESTYSVYNFEGQDWKGKQTEVNRMRWIFLQLGCVSCTPQSAIPRQFEIYR